MKPQLVAFCATLAVAAGATSYIPQARADVVGNAAAYCQSSLPTSDVSIRKSPLSLRNQGSSNAFVSCALPSSGGQLTDIYVYLVNRNGTGIDVDCTYADGPDPLLDTPAYYPLSLPVVAGHSTEFLWSAAILGTSFQVVGGVTCLLPPGVDITVLYAYDT